MSSWTLRRAGQARYYVTWVQRAVTGVDVLVVTFQSPERAERCLRTAIDNAASGVRVWIWHNGEHQPTLDVVKRYVDHPVVARFHHSRENVRLRPALNWLFNESNAAFVSKLDDDALIPEGWPLTLVRAHEAVPEFGVIGSWRFLEDDFDPELASWKIEQFGEHQLLRNLWVEGTTFLMKRECVEELGQLAEDQSFTAYCIELGRRGWINGYYYPFVRYGNLDDPRVPYTLIRTEQEMADRLPLSAKVNGVETIDAWTQQIKRSAYIAQTAQFDPKYHSGWRRYRARAMRVIRRLRGDRRLW